MQADDLRMTYIGGPTLLIEFGGLRLLTDPTFDSKGGTYTAGPVTLYKIADPALDAQQVGAIDAVLLSHDHHFDNLDHAGRELLSSAKRVLTTAAGAERLQGNAVGLAPGQSIELASPNGRILRVTGTPARHGPADADRGPVTGFLLGYTDKPDDLIYVSGDTVWFDGVEETLRKHPQIRVAVLFLGAAHVPVVSSHLTFTAAEGVRVLQQLPHAVAVPVHFEGWKHFTESKPEIARAFAAAALSDRLVWLEPGVTTPIPV